MIENPRSGERLRFVSETPELLVMETRWLPGRGRTPPHVHPGMEERWTVLDGEAAFVIGDRELRAGRGETVGAPPGTPHEGWNPGEAEARLRIEMRPALRWRAFVERLFAGDDPLALLRDFPDEIAPPPRP